jgi:chitin disaccharide deacetylase
LITQEAHCGCSPIAPALAARNGCLIVNADDWGRDHNTTDRIADCVAGGTVSSVSAMVFMEDSERAADLAREKGIDAGLHLNFTSPFTSRQCLPTLARRQQKLAAFLLRHRLARVVFHPGLAQGFADVVARQIAEFQRLYRRAPARIDGHHHMHLSSNVLLSGLLPVGTIARRNFSFRAGEKSHINRFYRKAVDRVLARRHHLVDFLFSLAPVDETERLQRIFQLARGAVVELETHPVNPDEYRFLTGGEFLHQLADVSVAPRFAWPARLPN